MKKVFAMVEPGSAVQRGDEWNAVYIGDAIWKRTGMVGRKAYCYYRRLIPAPLYLVPSELEALHLSQTRLVKRGKAGKAR